MSDLELQADESKSQFHFREVPEGAIAEGHGPVQGLIGCTPTSPSMAEAFKMTCFLGEIPYSGKPALR